MKRCLITVIILFLILSSGIEISCTPDLPKEENDNTFTLGYETGYSWGYQLTSEDSHRKDLFWTPPDKIDEAQQFNSNVDILDFYIPKGYLTDADVVNLQFPDATPFNDKQKKQWMEAYNWGFYSGFMKGSKDCLEGKPSHSELLNPFSIDDY